MDRTNHVAGDLRLDHALRRTAPAFAEADVVVNAGWRKISMKKTLIVFAAKLDTSVRRYGPLLTELRKEPELSEDSAEFLVFDSVTHRLGLRRLVSFANDLAAQINQCWVTHGGFEEVILFGHSIGGLLMREAYLLAWGDSSEPIFAWARAVRRIVLLGVPNRGISSFRPLDGFGDRLVQLFLPWMHFTYEDSKVGSVFITNLRLRWIRRFRSQASDPGALPLVLQLRGTKDKIVQECDSADVLAFPQGKQVPVPGADHGTIALLPVQRGENRSKKLTEEGRARYALLRNAILRGPEALGLETPQPSRSGLPSTYDRVIFILHGIRARNIELWLKELQQQISARDHRTMPVKAGYDYFSALRFILPSVRRRNIRWLQNEYSQRLAENPDAVFGFIGHSNGTYMLGESLKQIPAMYFERVVLAGTVLPTNFFEVGSAVRNQVGAVRSDGARFDWPVGILCRVLRNTLWMKDVGTAGYDGFAGSFVANDNRFHAGGHSDLFTADNVRSMVDFVLGVEPAGPTVPLLGENKLFAFISRLIPALVGIALIGLVLLPALPGIEIIWWHWFIGLATGLVIVALVLDAV